MHKERPDTKTETRTAGANKSNIHKRQDIDHIDRLLAIQLARTGSTRVRCIPGGGQIELIARRYTRATDLVVVDYVMSPDTVPPQTVIHRGVDDNWDSLNDVDVIAPDALLQRR